MLVLFGLAGSNRLFFCCSPLSLLALRQLMQVALDHHPGTWSRVRGPLGATLMCLKRIRLHMAGPFQLINRIGEYLTITSTSPRLLKLLVRDAWQHMLATYVAEQIGFPGRSANFRTAQRVLPTMEPAERSMANFLCYRQFGLQRGWSEQAIMRRSAVSIVDRQTICITDCSRARTRRSFASPCSRRIICFSFRHAASRSP